jgi:transcriptional regulator of acetoin/glycerol metabolism
MIENNKVCDNKCINGIRELTREMEKVFIVKVLNSVNWHLGKAAEILRIDRSTLYRKMKRCGIENREK